MDQIDLNPTLEVNNLKETLANLGEKELLNRLKYYMEIGQIDDDTALVKPTNNKLLINTDVLVEDVHFSTKTTSAEDIGWKAITTNLSDLIASGADQFLYISIGLIAPPETEWLWIKGVYEGINEALNKFGGKIIGGDCSKGKEKILAITAIGALGKLRLHRSNAKPGDFLVTSGSHGLSRLGLALISDEPLNNKQLISNSLKKKAIEAHKRPYPKIEAFKELKKSKPKDLPWRAAGTDSSDGLIEAIESICSSSKCQAQIDQSILPRSSEWPSGSKWDEWCLYGGEDYQLVLSLPPKWAKSFVELSPNAQKIGEIKAGFPKIIWKGKSSINQNSNFKHF